MSNNAVHKWLPAFISAAVLGVFAIIGSSLVGLSYEGTVDRIAQNERDALLRQMAAVLPQNRYDNDLLNDQIELHAPDSLGDSPTKVYRARKNGEDVAAIFSPVTTPGYAGDIVLLVGIYTDGSVAGVRVVTHRETPGLGDKIEVKRHPWITSFAGKSLDNPNKERWRVKRDGGNFDQFTGATITPRTVVAAVKRTLEYFHINREQIFAQAAKALSTETAQTSNTNHQASGHG